MAELAGVQSGATPLVAERATNRSRHSDAPMRVLVAHNRYQQKGGEDAVVASEIQLLRSKGVLVEEYYADNSGIGNGGIKAAAGALWSGKSFSELSDIISSTSPDIVHFHNTFPVMSPSVYWAASRWRVPVVQTLHNFRLLCASALFFRNGEVCEDCLGRLPVKAIAHGCYRGSRSASAAVVSMLALHRALSTYEKKVSAYIALNEFCRRKFVEGGLPARKIHVKPNFIDDPMIVPRRQDGFLYVGRISREKGVETLASAVPLTPGLKLVVAGTGPEMGRFQGLESITIAGHVEQRDVFRLMAEAVALVVPSSCYEGFPRTIVEAFACGLPVIASKTGSLAEIVTHAENGLLVEPGNARELSEAMIWAAGNPAEMIRMGRNAREKYEREFTSDRNFETLMKIYRAAAQADRDPAAQAGSTR